MTATDDVTRLNAAQLHMLKLGLQIATAAVLTDLEDHAVRVQPEYPPFQGRWYDVAHLREGADQLSADMAAKWRTALDYALQSGLVVVHPHDNHLVCRLTPFQRSPLHDDLAL